MNTSTKYYNRTFACFRAMSFIAAVTLLENLTCTQKTSIIIHGLVALILYFHTQFAYNTFILWSHIGTIKKLHKYHTKVIHFLN